MYRWQHSTVVRILATRSQSCGNPFSPLLENLDQVSVGEIQTYDLCATHRSLNYATSNGHRLFSYCNKKNSILETISVSSVKRHFKKKYEEGTGSLKQKYLNWHLVPKKNRATTTLRVLSFSRNSFFQPIFQPKNPTISVLLVSLLCQLTSCVGLAGPQWGSLHN